VGTKSAKIVKIIEKYRILALTNETIDEKILKEYTGLLPEGVQRHDDRQKNAEVRLCRTAVVRGDKLRKLIMLAAILALALVAAVPAMAQLTSGIEHESESADVALGFDVSNTGNYASQCTPTIQFGQTGNFENASSFVQYDGEADDFEPGGIEFSVAPEQSTDCSSTTQQSSAASA